MAESVELPASFVAWLWSPFSKTWRKIGAATTPWECNDIAERLADSGPRVVKVLPEGSHPDGRFLE